MLCGNQNMDLVQKIFGPTESRLMRYCYVDDDFITFFYNNINFKRYHNVYFMHCNANNKLTECKCIPLGFND